MRVYEAIVRGLEGVGVGAAFGRSGENAAGLMLALKHSASIRPVITRHEQAASFMACGYAMYSGRLGVCFATAGPGAFNLFPGWRWPCRTPIRCWQSRLCLTRLERQGRAQRERPGQPDAQLPGHVRRHDQEVVPARKMRQDLRRARGGGQPGLRRAARPSSHPCSRESHTPLVSVDNYRDVDLRVKPVLPDAARLRGGRSLGRCLVEGQERAGADRLRAACSNAGPELQALLERLPDSLRHDARRQGHHLESHPLSLASFATRPQGRARAFLAAI